MMSISRTNVVSTIAWMGLLSLCLCTSAARPASLGDIPAPRDAPYPGPIALVVTATDREHRVFRVRETLPVRPGPLVLLHPTWIPGSHAPVNQIKRVAGLSITANGKPLAWTRDDVDLQALHVDVPVGTTSVDIAFDSLLPRPPNNDTSVITDSIVHVKWEGLIFYPAGHYASRIDVDATLVLPDGWTYASALRARPAPSSNPVTFERTSLETLIDSPVMGGRFSKRMSLDADGAARPVMLDVFADDAKALEVPAVALDAHRAMVTQAELLFGSRHFRHYDILLALSEDRLGIGLEHHESTEMSLKSNYFNEWSKSVVERYALPHEFVHSWNGKFRRPQDLSTSNFNVPMRNSLLWVYEGQTQYWGEVLAARAGMMPLETMKERFARAAAYQQIAPGRRWRNLQDTTFDEIVQGREIPLDWPDQQRAQDYYSEGQLIWFDVDTIIRERSGGLRSLDDFASAFFGVDDGRVAPLTYVFDDVVAALERVQPYDWKSYLRARLDTVGSLPIEGFERAGWRLAWTDQESDYTKIIYASAPQGTTSFFWTLGCTIQKDGEIANVRWDGPAFRAGLSNGATLLAVGMREYAPDVLKAEVAAAKGRDAPIDLLVKSGKDFRVVHVDYHDGIRFPTLERIEGRPDLLTPILTAR